MLVNLIKKIKDEKGLSEAATAIIVLPIILGALFVMLDVGFYMRTRSMLDTIVQDTVMFFDTLKHKSMSFLWITIFKIHSIFKKVYLFFINLLNCN